MENKLTTLKTLVVIQTMGNWDIYSKNIEKYMTIDEIKKRIDRYESAYGITEKEIEEIIKTLPSLFASRSKRIGDKIVYCAYRLNFMALLFENN